MCDNHDAIVFLKSHGLHRTSVIGAYHAMRVALLMARALSLYGMTPGAQLDGTVLTHESGKLHHRGEEEEGEG